MACDSVLSTRMARFQCHFRHRQFGASVEGIWQGLKVFDKADVDLTVLQNKTMKGIKRSVRRFGKGLGHRAGIHGDHVLPYLEARKTIYLPTYRWVLENCLQEQVSELKKMSLDKNIVLLDYQTNGDLEDLSKPLSHAALVKRYVEGEWPETLL